MDPEDEDRQVLQQHDLLNPCSGLDPDDEADAREIERRQRLALDHAAGRIPSRERQAALLRQLDELDEAEFRACLEASVRAGRGWAMQLWARLYRVQESPAATDDPFDAARGTSQRLKAVD